MKPQHQDAAQHYQYPENEQRYWSHELDIDGWEIYIKYDENNDLNPYWCNVHLLVKKNEHGLKDQLTFNICKHEGRGTEISTPAGVIKPVILFLLKTTILSEC